MSVKSILAGPFASVIARQVMKWSKDAARSQEFLFHKLIHDGKKTAFGKEHDFQNITTHKDFIERVPTREYEAFKPYIERIKQGEENVLWKGKPVYFAKSSGTTSGVKYIPITRDSVPNHIDTARNALLMYIAETGNRQFVNGKMIFLSGSPELEKVGGILTGRLSGIVNHHVPRYLRGNQLPSYETNCIEDWEEKVEKIVEETWNQDMTLVSGIPPWVQMYFEKLLAKTGKKNIKEVFPNLSLLVYGGVNFEPYRTKLFNTIGATIDSIETYPASEGFFAFQSSQTQEGLLLNVDSGIFFEFIPVAEIDEEKPTRLLLKDVQQGINYALVISSNAGLWAYSVGDVVKFVSTSPYRLVVTGRTKHFISAFGEHVIGEEVESALMKVVGEEALEVVEFTVAPQVNPANGELPYHEWLIEFSTPPDDINAFRLKVDEEVRMKNIYYNDLISGNILQPLKITLMQQDAFRNYMKSVGKLGGQNKVPRLSNDRKLADSLQQWTMPL
ncbi:MAG TPA: GH3 auxin-responsive promoter family protein [Chitinophagales bacterium]|nr:GH3 auxin-responsive promoter family protein [Chitinophagales bacterium]